MKSISHYLVAVALILSLLVTAIPVAAQDDLAVFRWFPAGAYTGVIQYKPATVYKHALFDEFAQRNAFWRESNGAIPLPEELVRMAQSATITESVENIQFMGDSSKSEIDKNKRVTYEIPTSRSAIFAVGEHAEYFALRVEKALERIKPFLESGAMLRTTQRIGKYPLYAVDPHDEEGTEADSYCLLVGGGIILAAKDIPALQKMHDAGKGTVESFAAQEDFTEYADAAALGGDWIYWSSYRSFIRAIQRTFVEQGLLAEEFEWLADPASAQSQFEAAFAEIFALGDALKITEAHVYADSAEASAALNNLDESAVGQTPSTDVFKWREAETYFVGRVIAGSWYVGAVAKAHSPKD